MPRPPSSRRHFHPPRRIQEHPISMNTSLDQQRLERHKALQELALKGDRRAKEELVAMGLTFWWRGRTIIKTKEDPHE